MAASFQGDAINFQEAEIKKPLHLFQERDVNNRTFLTMEFFNHLVMLKILFSHFCSEEFQWNLQL